MQKAADELRGRTLHFKGDTVGPVRAAFDEANNIVNEMMAEAAKLEDQSPMLYQGIARLMEDAIEGFPRANWSDKQGRVTLVVAAS